ncbi:MAG: ATPase [SAR86 cluster bacterium]|uniref:histidine kinase n=1 Tax=SAR86 cluster bacterium TaxID=2030880 RepID=A0A2A4MFY9_9GAMM|nr:MAG: ATPase [SAR86 cluster bacterium]
MNFELTTIFGLGIAYLSLLFGIAYSTNRGWIPQKIVHHPAVYVLSLGVFASVWAYHMSVGNAQREGYGYLAQYVGISLAFLLSPLLLRPLLELTRTHQLSSLADLIAFRYRSPWAGTLTTLCILIGVTPLIALQIQAVADTISLLSPDASPNVLAFSFCIMITLFAVLFGTSHSSRSRHDGLVMAIAFESVVKLFALLAVGVFAIYGGFGGFGAMEQWLQSQPELIETLKGGSNLSSFHVLALLFFTATVAMPHMFYLSFNENSTPRKLAIASWGVPLYFLILSLPILPILWAGLHSGSTVQAEYFPVIIGMEYQSELFTLIGFIGSLSAASGLIIVITLALSNMCLNHLVLPLFQPKANDDIYKWLLHRRRILITGLIWAGFLFYYLPSDRASVQIVGIVAFSACLQFLPGIIAILYWPQANKKGFIAGLITGVCLWFLFLIIPIFIMSEPISILSLNLENVAIFSLIYNSLLFVIVSLLTSTSSEELSAADLCALDTIKRRKRTGLVAKSSQEFIKSLSKPLGKKTATREVNKALKDLKISKSESRPYTLRLLRGRLEANLSGLMGPTFARELIDSYLPFRIVSEYGSTDVNVIESRIESYRSNLSGMAADLDNLRRYHRQILLDLPLGVCSLGVDQEIIMWNHALEELTGIKGGEVIGSSLSDLANPWQTLLGDFIIDNNPHAYKQHFDLGNRAMTVNLHKASIEKPGNLGMQLNGLIILLEDITETAQLEASLTHSERLASIGRFAAGVAHEIGNPITGIACLAQHIRDEYPEDELNSMAKQIIEQTKRTSTIVQSLVNFAHAGNVNTDHQHEVVNIKECFTDTKTLISLDNKNRELNFEFTCVEGAAILADAQRLLQVFVNLLSNARDASQASNTISMDAKIINNQVQISVTDEGFGIPISIQDRIFDPFFTTKEVGDGTGLGLSLVFSIIEEFNGTIEIISPYNKDRGNGTQVILRFPCYHAQ